MGRRAREKRTRRRDEARGRELHELVVELGSRPGYATGHERFPRAVSDEDAVAIAEALHGELDEGAAIRARLAGERGMPLACDRGCTACCEEVVVVYRPEAARVARFLLRPENASALAGFRARYPAWRAALADVDRLADLAARDDARDEYEALHRALWRRRVLCAFNDGGLCTVYDARPMVCRNAHAIGTSDRCVGGSPIPAERLTFGPTDQLMGSSAFLLRAAHNAGADRRNYGEALCAYVHRLVTERAESPGTG